MVIDEVHRVAFVHIPKCAGTTVSSQLRGKGAWVRREGLLDHPELGRISPAHIPLAFLRSHFPEDFARISDCESFALIRDPSERFASAVFERIAFFGGVDRLRITVPQALKEARSVIRWLKTREAFCDAEFIHFSRQVDFIFLEGDQIVRHIYPLEHISDFSEHFGRVSSVRLDLSERLNANYATTQAGAFALLYRLNPIYRRLTSKAFRLKAHRGLRRLYAGEANAIYDHFREDREISAFVESYYAKDFELHRAALAGSRSACLDVGS